MCITKLVINLETLVSILFVKNFFYFYTRTYCLRSNIWRAVKSQNVVIANILYRFFLTFEIFVIVHYELHLKKFNFTNDFWKARKQREFAQLLYVLRQFFFIFAPLCHMRHLFSSCQWHNSYRLVLKMYIGTILEGHLRWIDDLIFYHFIREKPISPL